VYVTDLELRAQETAEQRAYLQLPQEVMSKGIMMIDSLPRLIKAAHVLGIPLSTTWGTTGQGVPGQGVPGRGVSSQRESSGVRLWVGVDSEWRAIITRKKNPYSSAPIHSPGAAILQVTTNEYAMIFVLTLFTYTSRKHHIYIYINRFLYMYVYIHIHTYIYIYMYMYIYIYIVQVATAEYF
jgi:hypothetical protein